MKTLFVSRELNENDPLFQFCESKGWKLLAKSMIRFECIESPLPKNQAEVVFFTSPRSVTFFLDQDKIEIDQKIACIGSKTADFIKKSHYSVDFYAKNEKIPRLAAEEFKSWLGMRRVLFPISDKSNKSMQKILPPNNYDEIVVYKTLFAPIKLDFFPDYILFSSPSNVDAFLELNSINKKQKVYAWGETTQAHLLSFGVESEIFYTVEQLL
jgi:uroporphyrinogen-III synthase